MGGYQTITLVRTIDVDLPAPVESYVDINFTTADNITFSVQDIPTETKHGPFPDKIPTTMIYRIENFLQTSSLLRSTPVMKPVIGQM